MSGSGKYLKSSLNAQVSYYNLNMASMLCNFTDTPEAVIVTPQFDHNDFRQYKKFKVTKKGFLWAYWNAGNLTRSGFYRDCLGFAGSAYENSEIVRAGDQELKIYKKA